MTKHRKKQKGAKNVRHTGDKSIAARETNKTKIPILLLIAILAGIPFALGKYIEFNTPGAFDSGSYVYSAAHIVSGAEIGVDEKPSARMGTLLVNMAGVRLFGFNETGPEIIQMIMQAAALILMFIAARRLFGTLPAAVSVIVASIFLSSPLFAKFGNTKEQYMIACMLLGVSLLILYELDEKWWLAVLAGVFLTFAPLFKPTGTTALGAVGIFVIAQPIFRHKNIKQTAKQIILLFAGAVILLAPLYLWLTVWQVRLPMPYKFVFKTVGKFMPETTTNNKREQPEETGEIQKQQKTSKKPAGYIARSRKMVPFSKQFPRVMRYYRLAILPIAIALASIIAGIIRLLWPRLPGKSLNKKRYDRFVLLLAIWWLLDMTFVWISPRSYEQYYLPLTASGAMLGGYIIALCYDKAKAAAFKTKWLTCAAIGFTLMIITTWHVFFGIATSPHSGTRYSKRIKGYKQRLEQIAKRKTSNLKAPWEIVGQYIRLNSSKDDKIYVWGWYPGIYVEARRFSPTSSACMMPRPAPKTMKKKITAMLTRFREEPPKFIVDSRKNHIPLDRPPYQLWPQTKNGFLPPDNTVRKKYDKMYAAALREKFGDDEAERYEILGPFRKFVMQNYSIAHVFGSHILFELKNTTITPE